MLNMELELTIPRPRVACSSNRASQASQCSYILIMKLKKRQISQVHNQVTQGSALRKAARLVLCFAVRVLKQRFTF